MNDKFSPRSPRDLIDLVRSQPLAWIVSGAAGALQATVLPVQLECDDAGQPLRILGHFGRSNDHWRQLVDSPRATVLLLGPQGYISPSWFADRTQAPTWNFSSACFDVEVDICDTPLDAAALLRGLVDDLEQDRPAAWRIEDMGARYDKLAQGVVGFRARILHVSSRFKLGQDERDDVFSDIVRGLELTGADELAGWMRRFGDTRAPVAAVPPPSPLDPDIMRFIDDVRDTGRRLTAGRVLDWPARRAIAEQSRLPWQAGGPVIASVTEQVADT